MLFTHVPLHDNANVKVATKCMEIFGVYCQRSSIQISPALILAPSRPYPAYLPLACAWLLWFAGHYNWHRSRRGEVGKKRSRQAKRVAVLPLQDEGAQPLNLSSKPKTSESKSPTSPASPQVPAMKLGPGSMKHSAPSSIGGPLPRVSSIGTDTISYFFICRCCINLLSAYACQ